MTKSMYIKQSKQAVLLFHAYTGSPNDVRMLARKIEKEGYTVYVPVFSGHGTNSPEIILEQNAAIWWQDAVNAINFLVAEGHTQIATFGLSMGGVFAMKLMENYPELIIGGGSFSSPLKPDHAQNVYAQFLKYSAFQYKKILTNEAEYTRKMTSIEAPLKRQLADINDTVASVYQQLNQINQPVFLAQSGKDELVDASVVYKAAKQITKTSVQVNWYPNSTHVITISNDKHQFEEDVIHFVNKLSWE